MIKKFFEKDSVLKIVSLFIAVLVWLYVIYIEDPEVEKTIDDIPIAFKVAELTEDLSVIDYDVKEIDVKISGNRSDVMSFEDDELTAVLDLSSVSKAGKYEKIKVNVTTTNKKIEIVEISAKTAVVEIDDVISREFKIDAEFTGDMPSGFIVADKPIITNDSVTVKGAKRYINSIDGAYIAINTNNLTNNRTFECNIYLKDKKGKTIDKTHTAYKSLKLSENTVSAYVSVEETNMAQIEIRDLGDIKVDTLSPKEIEVYSKSGLVNKIYTKSIQGKEPDKDGYITLKLDIPEGVTVINSEDSVKVKVRNN